MCISNLTFWYSIWQKYDVHWITQNMFNVQHWWVGNMNDHFYEESTTCLNADQQRKGNSITLCTSWSIQTDYTYNGNNICVLMGIIRAIRLCHTIGLWQLHMDHWSLACLTIKVWSRPSDFGVTKINFISHSRFA